MLNNNKPQISIPRVGIICLFLCLLLNGVFFAGIKSQNKNENNDISLMLGEQKQLQDQSLIEADSTLLCPAVANGEGPSKLTLNYNPNPGFEAVESNQVPSYYNQYGSSTYRRVNMSYTDIVSVGNSAALIQSKGSNVNTAYGNLYHSWGMDNVPVADGLVLEADYYLKTAPDLNNSGLAYLYLNIGNSTYNYNIYFYLSHNLIDLSPDIYSTYSRYYFDRNSTLNSWHELNENLTQLFETEIYPSSAGFFVTYLEFEFRSPSQPQGLSELVIDEVYLNDSSDTPFIGNSDFESGSSWWNYASQSMGYVTTTQTTATEGTRALNLSVSNTFPNQGSYGDANCGYDFEYPAGFYISDENACEVSFDWYFHDQATTDTGQFAYCYIRLYNNSEGYRNIYYVLGGNNDDLLLFNYSYEKYIFLDSFGQRDEWVHTSLNPYEIIEEFAWFDMAIYYIYFGVVMGSDPNAEIELLVDDFELRLPPLGDPGFEQTWYELTPFTGWQTGSSTLYVNRTRDCYSGDWAANLTTYNGIGGISLSRYNSYLPIIPNVTTHFRWRLDEITTVNGYARFRLFFISELMNANLYYYIGNGTGYTIPTNTTTSKYIVMENTNNVGSWQLFNRYLEHDLNSSFGDHDWVLDDFHIQVTGYVGDRISLIVDDMDFKETERPTIQSVELINIPKYYIPATIHLECFDQITEINNVSIYYRVDSGSWDHVEAIRNISHPNGYTAIIPNQDYGTMVEYYAEAFDVMGNRQLEDNGGLYYHYSPIDDINPSVQIQRPYNNTIISDTYEIQIQATDEGSDIDHVEIYANAVLLANVASAPYTYAWNTRLFTNGEYLLTALAVDAAGNTQETLLSTNVILDNDFNPPVLSTVTFNNTAPAPGDWVKIYVGVYDESNLSNISLFYRFDNVSAWVMTEMAGDNYQYSGVILTGSDEGEVYYKIEAWDLYDQMQTIQGSFMVLDQIKPELQVDGPPTSQILSGDGIRFTLIGSDAESGIDYLEIFLNGSTTQILGDNGVFLWDTTAFANGNYSIVFRAYDQAGNMVEESYVYQIYNPTGFIAKTWDSIDQILQSYYGMAVGAGGLGILILMGVIIRARAKKK